MKNATDASQGTLLNSAMRLLGRISAAAIGCVGFVLFASGAYAALRLPESPSWADVAFSAFLLGFSVRLALWGVYPFPALMPRAQIAANLLAAGLFISALVASVASSIAGIPVPDYSPVPLLIVAFVSLVLGALSIFLVAVSRRGSSHAV